MYKNEIYFSNVDYFLKAENGTIIKVFKFWIFNFLLGE